MVRKSLPALFALCLPVCVPAVPVTYDFEGTIGSVAIPGIFILQPTQPAVLPLNLPPGLDAGGAMLGQIIRGSITLDPDAGVDELPLPDRGQYSGFEVISAFSLSLNGFDFTLDPRRDGVFARALVSDIDTRRTNFVSFGAG
jgi:hypothetical protein